MVAARAERRDNDLRNIMKRCENNWKVFLLLGTVKRLVRNTYLLVRVHFPYILVFISDVPTGR